MNKYNKLITNSLIFAVGNLGSKLILILLVPLYTYSLSTNDYGIADIVLTTTNLLLPIVSLSIFDGVLRFTMEKKEKTSDIFTSGFYVTVIGNIIFLLFFFIFLIFFKKENFIVYLYVAILLFLMSFQSLFSQYARAVGLIKIFSINGILTAAILCLSNVVLLVYFNLGLEGYLLSQVLSFFISNIYLMKKINIFTLLKKGNKNKILVSELLKYSIPLIPNAFMWWIINSSNRYLIVAYAGLAANGLFAVANKIPSVLSILQSIFFQSWQLSAIEEFDDNDSGIFFSKVFKYFYTMMFIVTALIISTVKPIFLFALAKSFYESWKIVPFLTLGVTFSSFSAFVGTTYIASKNTKGALKTTIVGGIINVIVSLVAIRYLGAIGAGISTAISFYILFIYRILDTEQFIKLKIEWGKLHLFIIVIIIQAVCNLLIEENYIYIFNIIVIVLILFLSKKELTTILEKINFSKKIKKVDE